MAAAWRGRVVTTVLVPLVSVVCGFLVGAIAIVAAGADPLVAYGALFAGAFTNHNALAETLVSTTPYLGLGLAVALGFRAGLFNIGAEGQFYIGSLAGTFVAYSIHGLPPVRAVGFSQGAARAAGISVGRTIVLTMALSGALAGFAGIVEVLGVNYHMTDTVAAGYGFDAIAVALLARSNPWGVLPAAFLFGALHNGAGFMQLETQISSDLISIVQASVIIFVAAPVIVGWLFRLRRAPAETVHITQREVDAPVT